jgi:hypothetical protein
MHRCFPVTRLPGRCSACGFDRIGCAACHRPSLGAITGIYSDLLLHDMGDSLSRAVNFAWCVLGLAGSLLGAEPASTHDAAPNDDARMIDRFVDPSSGNLRKRLVSQGAYTRCSVPTVVRKCAFELRLNSFAAHELELDVER